MATFIARFKEPSTYAGIAAGCVAIGKAFPNQALILDAVAGVCSALAVMVSEKGSSK